MPKDNDKDAKLWRILYKTPRGSTKEVIWRGSTDQAAVASWLALTAPGSELIQAEPVKVSRIA